MPCWYPKRYSSIPSIPASWHKKYREYDRKTKRQVAVHCEAYGINKSSTKVKKLMEMYHGRDGSVPNSVSQEGA